MIETFTPFGPSEKQIDKKKAKTYNSVQRVVSVTWRDPFPYLAGLRRVENVHGARLNAIGFGPLVKGKSAFPSTPVSIR